MTTKKIFEKFLTIDNDSKVTKVARALLLLFPLPFIPLVIDNDFWFQIKSGQTIVDLWPNGFLTVEPFTIHEGWAFSFEKWLTDVSFYEIYKHYGNVGIYLTVVLACIILIALLYKTCVYVSGNKTISAYIVAISLAFFSYGFEKTRPQIIAYILLVAEIYVLERYVKSNNWKELIWLPVLSVIYMQFHSTMWPVFFIFMLPYLFEFKKLAVKGTYAESYKKLPILIAMLISVAAGLINPNGVRSILYLINSGVTEINKYIMDLQPSYYGTLIYFGPVLLVHLIYYFNKNRSDIPLRYMFFNIGTFAMLLFAQRNAAYYILSGIIISSFMLKDVKDEQKKLPKVLVGSIFIVTIFYSLIFTSNLINIDKTIYKETAGKKATDFLSAYVVEHNENKDELKIYTGFNDGSYAEWNDFKCYMDPRGEVFVESINKKEDVFMEYVHFYKGTTSHKTLQDKYNFDYWILSNNSNKINYMLEDPNYESLFEDDTYHVLKYNGE